MKYIKVFNQHSEYETFINGQDAELPNVSHCVQENDVHYNAYVDPTLLYLRHDSVNNRDVVVDYKGRLLLDEADSQSDIEKILYRTTTDSIRWIADGHSEIVSYYRNLYGVSDLEFECTLLDTESRYDSYSWGQSSWDFEGAHYDAGDFVDSQFTSRITTGTYPNYVEYNPPMYIG